MVLTKEDIWIYQDFNILILIKIVKDSPFSKYIYKRIGYIDGYKEPLYDILVGVTCYGLSEDDSRDNEFDRPTQKQIDNIDLERIRDELMVSEL